MNKEKISTKPEYQYLQFVEFKDFLLWDVKKYTKKLLSYLNKDFTYLKDHIEERSQKIKLANYPKDDFGILGVNNETGIFDAYLAKGSEINQPYKKLETDWLAYNPYRINVGSVGLKTKGHIGQYISPAYVVFSCKNSLLPEFLFKLFKTKNFNDLIKENTSGSVRQILSFEALKNIQIPLPSLAKQQELIAKYNQKTLETETKEQKANQLEKSIDEYLIEELGIELPQAAQSQDSFLKTVEFKDLSRWDAWNKPSLERKSKYPLIKFEKTLDKIISKVNKVKTNEFKEIGSIPIVSQEKEFISGYTDLKIKPIEKEDLPLIIFGDHSQTKKIINFEFIVGADGVRLLKPKKEFDLNYYFYYLESIKFQTSQKYTRHYKYLKNEFIPLPPLEIQNKIADKISSIKQEIKTLRSEAEKLRTQAKEEFENEVF